MLANSEKIFDMVCTGTGRKVFGGGYDINADPSLVSVSSYPVNQTTWRVVVRTTVNSGASFSFRNYAVCATSN